MAKTYTKHDMILFAGTLAYRAANPKSEMGTPNTAYLLAEKELESYDECDDITHFEIKAADPDDGPSSVGI